MFKFLMSEGGKVLLNGIQNNKLIWDLNSFSLTIENEEISVIIWLNNGGQRLISRIYSTKGMLHATIELNYWDKKYIWKFIKPFLHKWEDEQHKQALKKQLKKGKSDV